MISKSTKNTFSGESIYLSATNHSFVSSRFWRILPAGMRRRWWLFRFFDLAVRWLPVFKKRSGMLVVRMDGIGDMVLFRRALDQYARVFEFNKSEITVLGCQSWGTIGQTIFEGYQLRIIDEHAFAKRLFYRFKMGLMVKFLAPKLTVCDQYFRRAMMADSLVWMVGAPRSISSLPFINEATRPEFKYYLSQVDQVVDTGPYPTHEVLRHYWFLSHIAGRQLDPEPPKIKWRDRFPDISELKNKNISYAVINPGSNEYGRRWPIENYLNIANRLNEAGLRVVIIGGPGEKIAGLKGRIDGDGIIDLRGKTILPDLLDVINHAKCMISNDTGPAHLSIALETPTVVIVGGGHFSSFVPYPDKIRPIHVKFAFEEMPCYHCFWNCNKRENKLESFPCVSAISPDNIWKQTEELIYA